MCFQSKCLQIKTDVPDVSKVFTENLFQSLQKIYILQKICFKVKVLKTFKVSTDCRIKPFSFLKRGAILKIPRIVFQRDLCSFCWLQNETPKDNNFPMSRIHWRLLAILEASIKSVSVCFLICKSMHLLKVYSVHYTLSEIKHRS